MEDIIRYDVANYCIKDIDENSINNMPKVNNEKNVIENITNKNSNLI